MQSIGNFYYYVELIIFLFVSGKYSPHRGKNELISTLKKKKINGKEEEEEEEIEEGEGETGGGGESGHISYKKRIPLIYCQ